LASLLAEAAREEGYDGEDEPRSLPIPIPGQSPGRLPAVESWRSGEDWPPTGLVNGPGEYSGESETGLRNRDTSPAPERRQALERGESTLANDPLASLDVEHTAVRSGYVFSRASTLINPPTEDGSPLEIRSQDSHGSTAVEGSRTEREENSLPNEPPPEFTHGDPQAAE
jgi:hypothetical protein